MSDQELFDYLADLSTKVRAAIRDAVERDEKFFPAFDGCRADRLVELERPDMPTMFTTKCLNKDGRRARKILAARWVEIELASRDTIFDTLKAMASFVDEGWDGASSYSPSEMMILRYFIEASDRENPERVTSMKEQAMGWIEEARQRWRAGFSANPFGPPIKRLA